MPATTTHRIRHYVYCDGALIPREPQMRGDWPCEAKCSCGWESHTGGGVRRWVDELVRDHKWDVKHGFYTPKEV